MFLSALLMTALFAVTPLAGSAEEETVTINVYNWGQYMALGEEGAIHVNEEFTKRTGIKVNYAIYESNEVMYTKLKTGGANYDVIYPIGLYDRADDQRGYARGTQLRQYPEFSVYR